MVAIKYFTLALSYALTATALTHNRHSKRDLTTVVDDLAALGADLGELDAAVTKYTGGLILALPVTAAELKASATILKTTIDVQQSANFSDADSTTIALTLAGLEPNITGTLADITAKVCLHLSPTRDSRTSFTYQMNRHSCSLLSSQQPEFAASLLSPIVLLDLKTLKAQTDALVSAIESKVTATFAGLIATGSQAIDAAYDSAIAAYE